MTEATTRFFFDTPEQQVDTGTARLALRRFGSGPPLLLVHGFPLSGFTWRKVLPELSRRYTCYVPDLPGMGESEWTDATDFSFPGQGRTLKVLVDRLGLERYACWRRTPVALSRATWRSWTARASRSWRSSTRRCRTTARRGFLSTNS